MNLFKEYEEKDYWFQDSAGNWYMSTPEYDVMGTLLWIFAISGMVPFMIGFIMWGCL